MVAWQRSGALEAFPRYHDNRSWWTNREAELLSWVAAGQVHLWTMLGARGLPATGPGGHRRFALLQRSLSSAEMNVPRGRERERERQTETDRERGADGRWCSILISGTDDEQFREEPRRICYTPRYGLSLGNNYFTLDALNSDDDVQTGIEMLVTRSLNDRHRVHETIPVNLLQSQLNPVHIIDFFRRSVLILSFCQLLSLPSGILKHCSSLNMTAVCGRNMQKHKTT